MLRSALRGLLVGALLVCTVDSFVQLRVPLKGAWRAQVTCRRRPAVMLGTMDDDQAPEGNKQKSSAVSGSIPRTGPDAAMRDAFRQSWKKRFSGLGKEFNRPDPEEVASEEGSPAMLGEILDNIVEDEEELKEVRVRRQMLEHSLEAAVDDERYDDAVQIRDELRRIARKDPVSAIMELQKESQEAAKRSDLSAAATLSACAMQLRRFAPQYNLAGTWRGHYGRNGWETVELRYEGDKLIATKKTGDANVPAGAITFTADISRDGILGMVGSEPTHPAEKIRGVLETHLDGIVSFKGQGQVAASGFKNAQYVPGQLMLFSEGMLGFLWLPLGSMIMFEYLGEDAERRRSDSQRPRRVSLEEELRTKLASRKDDEVARQRMYTSTETAEEVLETKMEINGEGEGGREGEEWGEESDDWGEEEGRRGERRGGSTS